MIGAGSAGCHLRAMVAASLLLLSACGKVRYPTNYVLNFPRATPQMAGADAPFGPVVVRRLLCSDYACEGRIAYRPTPEQVAFYEYHRWAMDPRDSVTQHVADDLRSRSLFKHVARPETRIQPTYVLSGSIDRLEEVDDGAVVRAVCAMSMQVIQAETGTVVWSDMVSETLPVEERSVAGVVRSLSAVVRRVVDQLMKSMETQLRSSTQQQAPPVKQGVTMHKAP